MGSRGENTPRSRLPAATHGAHPKKPAPTWLLPVSSDPWGRWKGDGIWDPESGWQELWAQTQTAGHRHCQQHCSSWLEGAGCYAATATASFSVQHWSTVSTHTQHQRKRSTARQSQARCGQKAALSQGSFIRSAGREIINLCLLLPHTLLLHHLPFALF